MFSLLHAIVTPDIAIMLLPCHLMPRDAADYCCHGCHTLALYAAAAIDTLHSRWLIAVATPLMMPPLAAVRHYIAAAMLR